MTGSVTGKDTMRPLRLDEFNLHDGGARLVDTGHTTTGKRLEGEQRHGGGTVVLSRG